MTFAKRYTNKQAKAIRRQRLHAQASHQRQHQQAQRATNALHQALHDLGLPANLVIALKGRLQTHKKLLGTVFGLMFPTLFGCRSASERTRVRGWDNNVPARLLGALPKRSWLTRLRKLGQDILVPLWRHPHAMSVATQSRWQWSGVWDDTVLRT